MPNLIYPDDSALSRPMRMLDAPSPRGARIGGPAPDPIGVALRDEATYFGTLPLILDPPERFFSLYLNCAFDQLILALNRGLLRDDRIAVALHDDRPRGTAARHASPLSMHPLEVGPPELDLAGASDGAPIFKEGLKFGGRPYCIQEPELPGAAELLRTGYRQVLQLDFPAPSSKYGRVSGSWPFGDGIFNLFWRPPFAGVPIVWCLQG